MAQRDLLENAQAKAKQTLAILETQNAGFGSLNAPAHLLIELEDQRQKVLKIETELARFDNVTTPPPPQNLSAILSELESNLTEVGNALVEGSLVFFLGNEANLTIPLSGSAIYPPGERELAQELAKKFRFQPDPTKEFLKVAQRVAVMNGVGSLYEELRRLLSVEGQPLFLHRALAALPAILREKGSPNPYQLIVTNHYDDLLEQAFGMVDEPFDLVAYVAEGDNRGKFRHWPPGNQRGVLIEIPNEYNVLSLKERTIILKIHGAVHGADPQLNKYAVTEDHYIDYMRRADISNLVPANLLRTLRWSHLLFLGYSLEDWSLRLILSRLWGEEGFGYSSWSVQGSPTPLDKKLWTKKEVESVTANLEVYLTGLTEQVRNLLELLEESR